MCPVNEARMHCQLLLAKRVFDEYRYAKVDPLKDSLVDMAGSRILKSRPAIFTIVATHLPLVASPSWLQGSLQLTFVLNESRVRWHKVKVTLKETIVSRFGSDNRYAVDPCNRERGPELYLCSMLSVCTDSLG
jgi:hypothetical protein